MDSPTNDTVPLGGAGPLLAGPVVPARVTGPGPHHGMPLAASSDDDLVALAKKAEQERSALVREQAARLLMARYGADVYRFCREQLRDASLAEDVHQQVFVEACRDLATFAGKSSLKTWLFGIARHRCLDAARRRHRQQRNLKRQIGLAAADDGNGPQPAERVLEDAELKVALSDCLHVLTPHVRELLLLCYQQELSFAELGRVVGAKADTVRARVVRALDVLKSCIEAKAGDLA